MNKNISLESFLKKLFDELTYENDSFSFVDENDPLIDDSILFKNVFKNNYYLTLFVDSLSDLKSILNNQAHYFFLLKEFFSELQEVDKNTSMIIFLKTTELNNESLIIEEDPYYFKKYIFPYTSEQFRSFSEEYTNQFTEFGIKKVLDEIISDADLFEEFKLNPENRSNNFDLVSKLFIKIPVLTLPINIDKDIYLLNDSIMESLENEVELLNVKQKIDSKIAEETVAGEEETNKKIIESLINFYQGKGE